jgi:negative regulator of flagellin synthesis FlgM
VDLSPRAQDMKKAKEIAMATPDVDEAKVARLQKMIDSGTYNVSAKDIADKMVDEEIAWS